MNRREFLENSIKFGMAAGAAFLIKDFNPIFGLNSDVKKTDYDMVAVKGGEPAVMFDMAMKEMGGMGNFVKPGQTVLVKPNIGWAVPPELAATTNPLLVAQIIKHCLDAGAKKVFVFDHSCDYGPECYRISGIEDAVKNAGGMMVPADQPGYFHNARIPGASFLKSADFHEMFLDANVFINVPILKNHRTAQLTIGMKNYMGIVWARDQWHRTDLEACIADCPLVRKPDLTVVDAYAVMMTHGPRGHSKDDIMLLKNLLVSTDMMAAEFAAAKIFGADPMNIEYLKIASEKKSLGNSDLSKTSIKKISL